MMIITIMMIILIRNHHHQHYLTIVAGLKELFAKLNAGHKVPAALLESHVRVVLQADNDRNQEIGSFTYDLMAIHR